LKELFYNFFENFSFFALFTLFQGYFQELFELFPSIAVAKVATFFESANLFEDFFNFF